MHLLVQHTRKGRIHLRSGHAETTTRPSMRGCNLKIFNTRRKPNESVQRGDRSPQVMNFFSQKRSDDSIWEPRSLRSCAFNKHYTCLLLKVKIVNAS